MGERILSWVFVLEFSFDGSLCCFGVDRGVIFSVGERVFGVKRRDEGTGGRNVVVGGACNLFDRCGWA